MINLRIFLKYTLIVALIYFSFGCRPRYEPGALFETENDFERILGWVQSPKNNSNTIIKGTGYKSDFGCNINKSMPYGYIFTIERKEVSPDPLTYVKIKVMIKAVTENVDSCGLTFSVEDLDGKLLSWVEAPLKNKVKPNSEWTEFEAKFDIGIFNSEKNKFSFMVWNHISSQELFVDNMKIEFY